MILNWLRIFRPEDPLRKVANVQQMNRIANILNNIEGVNCRIEKPTDAEGKNWLIVVDGGSDIAPPSPVPASWPNPFSGGAGEDNDEKVASQSGQTSNFLGTVLTVDSPLVKTVSGATVNVSLNQANLSWTQITVMTQVRYDTTTKQIQVKTRTAKVFDPGAESDWTMITGGQAVDCP